MCRICVDIIVAVVHEVSVEDKINCGISSYLLEDRCSYKVHGICIAIYLDPAPDLQLGR